MKLNTLLLKLGALFTLAFAALAMVFWFDLQEILQPPGCRLAERGWPADRSSSSPSWPLPW
jgi:hypothetical protein